MIGKAAEAIRRCERELQEIMAEAAAAGEYTILAKLVDWAKTLESLVVEQDQPAVACEEFSPSSVEAATGPIVEDRRTTVRPRSTARKKRKQYPQFRRSRNGLIKIGWSKKSKKEYQHRASWSVLETLCTKAEAWKGTDFVSEDLFPLAADDGTDIPSYQAYLCLAWLKDEQLILQNGRQGYHVPEGNDLLSAAKDRWKALRSTH